MEEPSSPPDATSASNTDKGQISSIADSAAAYNPENAVDTFELTAQTMTMSIVGVSFALLALLTNPIGWATGVIFFGAILANTLPVLWPAAGKDEGWKSLSGFAETLIQSHISAVVINDATADTRALIKEIESLNKNLDFWVKSNKTEGEGLLRNSIFTLLNTYVGNTEKLVRQQYRGILLPQYAQAAYHYVIALKSVYPYANRLDLSGASSFTGETLILTKLREAIETFTNQAIDSYRFGLKEITNRSNSTWYDYNAFRNTMTQTVLDLVAQFPYTDPVLYQAAPSNTWMNRSLFKLYDCDPRERSEYLNPAYVTQFEAYANKPTEVGWLSEILHGYRREITTLTLGIDGLTTVTCNYESIDGTDYQYAENMSGSDSIDNTEWRLSLKTSKVVNIEGKHWTDDFLWSVTLHSMVATIATLDYHTLDRITNKAAKEPKTFSVKDASDALPFYTSFPKKSVPASPQEEAQITTYAESLSEIRIVPDGRSSYSFLFCWRSSSLRHNVSPQIQHDPNAGLKFVEQYHAIKAARSISDLRKATEFGTESYNVLINGPGFTGGDLVWLRALANFSPSLEFAVEKDPTNPGKWFSGWYTARVWYVPVNIESAGINILLAVLPNVGVPSLMRRTIPYSPPPANLKELKYQDLKLYEFKNPNTNIPDRFGFFREASLITMRLSIVSMKGDIYVDRLELVFHSEASLFAEDVNEQHPSAKPSDAASY